MGDNVKKLPGNVGHLQRLIGNHAADRRVLKALADTSRAITVIAGESSTIDEGAIRTLVPANIELKYESGGQSPYLWLIAAEGYEKTSRATEDVSVMAGALVSARRL